MGQPLWTRLDWTTCIFCLSHIPAIIFVDMAPMYPDIALLRPLHWLRKFYIATFADPLMSGQSVPGAWFKCFLLIEVTFQLPACIAIVLAYRNGQKDATWTRLLIALYSIEVAASTLAALSEILAFQTITEGQKLALFCLYWPYVVVPLVMGWGHSYRLLQSERFMTHEVEYLRVRKQQNRTILLTGANSGVGFGCVERILDECRPALLCKDLKLNLILTVRSKAKADSILQRLTPVVALYGEALHIQFEMLDLLSIASTEALCARLEGQKIDTCIFNAGMSDLERFDLGLFATQLITAPIAALSTPEYNIQRVGIKTADGFGTAFQANLLSHYYIAKRLALSISNIIWTSSLEAKAETFNPGDMQALEHAHGYESSKRLMDLLYVTVLKAQGHFLVHPGFCATNIMSSVLPPILPAGLIHGAWSGCFRLLMLFGSQWHVASAYNGAYAASTLATAFLLDKDTSRYVGKKMGSAGSQLGNMHLAPTRMEPITAAEAAAVAKLDALVDTLLPKQ